MIISGIYKITNPEGCFYIGKSVNITKRWNSYKLNLGAGQPKLNESFIKFGVEAHKFDVIEICDPCKLTEREAYFIEDTFAYHSLNSTKCFKIRL